MALIVEDGTGRSDAESYASVADADAYHTKYGNTAWTGSTGAKETALRQATQYLDARFNNQWLGVKVKITQSLDWVRYGVYDESGYLRTAVALPVPLVSACCEAALRALTETLLPDIATPGLISAEAVSVGPISKSTSYVSGRSQIKYYRKVDMLIRPLVMSPGELIRG